MSGIKKLAGQTVLYGLSSIVGRMLNYLLVPIYTRIFSPAEYGVVSELYSYSAFLLILFTYGMETAFFNFMQKEENKNKVYENCISLVSYTTTILVLLMIFFSSPLAATIEYP
ncbi:MAG TPA: oligosaccharide flippase family protein, partial [Bacteroidia bacterium]|nr:oligosaccharide flippase family protein [Bacteroidia bacterium]HOZ89763.1 oligosaccharide flippase family protein [Bacteroidia bacterium]HQW18675.1 oligosaccharide flippase family protein [Bacteroidia bacterium]HQW50064.1 oligosaccharide flippase family protein [Bacteroidia bacterium]HRA59882.1 oligosaccharide flippase family protein [Bacteroidia bacterium]